MKSLRFRFVWYLGTSLILAGVLLLSLAITVEWLEIAPQASSEIEHLILVSFLTTLAGVTLRIDTVLKWLRGQPRVLSVGFVWLIILTFGLVGVELYARHLEGYLLWSWSLKRSYFFERDHLKVYNRRFYEQRRAYFRGWPIPLELFDADKPTPRYLFRPYLRMARHDNQLVPAEPGEEVYWSSNSWGFRGSEFSVEKSPDVIRIVCLGASTTEGSQRDQETYPYFLQQELNQLFPEHLIEVINAGHHGQDIDDLLEILKQRVLSLQPDVVIYYQAANNVNVYDFLGNMRCGVGFPQGDCWLNAYPRWYRWLYGHSAIFVLLSDQSHWNGNPPPMSHKFDETSPKPSATHYREVLQQIVRETLEHDSVIVLSSFITVAHAGLEVSYEDNPSLFDDLYRKWYPLTPGEIERIYQHFNQQSLEVAREFGVPYADVAAEFPRDIGYFPYDIIHFSPEGNQLLASLFAKSLAEDVLPEILNGQW